jgi:hypothetical protein
VVGVVGVVVPPPTRLGAGVVSSLLQAASPASRVAARARERVFFFIRRGEMKSRLGKSWKE